MSRKATSHAEVSGWRRRANGGWGWQWWWPRLLAGGFAALLLASAVGGAFAAAGLRHRIVTTGQCQIASVPVVYESRAPTDHGVAHLVGGATVMLWGVGLPDSGGPRTVSICRSAGGTWADGDGDASRWLLSSQAPTATIPISDTLLILAWVLNWERLRGLDNDPQASTPNDHAAVIGYLVTRRSRGDTREGSANDRTASTQPGDTPSGNAGARAARIRRLVRFFAIMAVLVILGALTVVIGGVPFGFGIRLPAPAALLIRAAIGGLVWQFVRPPRRRP
jgi:hypothetical protein